MPRRYPGILGHTKASFTLDTYTHVNGICTKKRPLRSWEILTDYLGEEMAPWQTQKTGRRHRPPERTAAGKGVVIGYDEKGLPQTKNVLARTKTNARRSWPASGKC